jgi:hypothetical protein
VVGVPALGAVLLFASDQPDGATQALGTAGTSAAALVAVGVLRQRRRYHHEHALSATRAAASRHAGEELRGVEAVAAWLNVHWWDAYPVYDLARAAHGAAVACSVAGHPALALAVPASAGQGAFIDVLVSAWYAGDSEIGRAPGARGAPEPRSALVAQGFSVRSGPSGVHAALRGESAHQRLKAGIDLGAVLEASARLAASQGGRPPDSSEPAWNRRTTLSTATGLPPMG